MDLFLIFITLLLSAFFSGSEIAFVVANRLKLEVRARKKMLGARSTLELANKPEKFLTTALVGTNVAEVAYASIFAVYLKYLFGVDDITVLILVSVSTLLIGEIIPKSIFREFADSVVVYSGIFLKVADYILYPLVRISSLASRSLVSLFRIESTQVSTFFTKQDMDLIVKESVEVGLVKREDRVFISRVFELGEQLVREVMIPRTEIVAVEKGASMKEIQELFVSSGFSKIPAYDETLDRIIGVIHARDLFRKPKTLKQVLREVMFVPESKKTTDLLREFREKKMRLAIVVDEFGGTAGLVTVEDVVEELLGEIHDEFDVEESIYRKLSSDTYLLSGRIEIDFVNEKFGIGIPKGDYETLAGYVMSKIGKIPSEGEEYAVDQFRIVVMKSSETKLDLLKLFVQR
ncbi:MAG TPA: hemolysin family protein [Bacteroidota bacterium]